MLQALGPLNSDQKYTLGVFLVVAFLWIFQPIVVKIFGHELLNDAQIAVLGGILMFIFPLGKKGSLLIKEDLHKIPWNILLLFGGGLALAGCFESSGLLPYAVDWLKTLPLHSSVLIVLVFSSSLVFISEFASNVALCNVALPFILTYCKGQNLDLSTVGMLCALATSFGFALPVATPPNAIVFGTGKIQIKDMLHVGLILDVVGVLLLVLVASVV